MLSELRAEMLGELRAACSAKDFARGCEILSALGSEAEQSAVLHTLVVTAHRYSPVPLRPGSPRACPRGIDRSLWSTPGGLDRSLDCHLRQAQCVCVSAV